MSDGDDIYRELFEHSPDAILVIEEGRFVDCNPAAARMLRFPDKQALLERYSGGDHEGSLSAHPADMSPPTQPDGRDSFEKAEENMRVAIERGSHRFEWDHLRADGEVFPVEVLLTAVERESRTTIHVVWREISERRKLEQELRQQQRLQSVGRLAGGIAHDFNNLLVVILNHAEMLRAELSDAGLTDHAESASEILAAGERAASLTRQLLTFSRGQPLKPRPTDLGEVIRGLKSLLERLIGEDIDFVVELPDTPLVSLVDTGRIEQLVVNLVTNGRDALPDGGRLAVSLSRHGTRRPSQLPRLPEADYAEIRVTDDGVGMGPEQLDRAFDPFFTTKAPGSGSGLGLSTVHTIAEQCLGGTWIESTPGLGTSVTVLLPLTPLDPVRDALPPESAKSASLGGNETILLVEDEERIRELVATQLERRGYTVFHAEDGQEALERFRRDPESIDLILSDVVMPRLSGPKFVEEALVIRPGTKVIFMSGYARDGAFSVSAISPDAEIIDKPFTQAALLALIRRVLDGG